MEFFSYRMLGLGSVATVTAARWCAGYFSAKCIFGHHIKTRSPHLSLVTWPGNNMVSWDDLWERFYKMKPSYSLPGLLHSVANYIHDSSHSLGHVVAKFMH